MWKKIAETSFSQILIIIIGIINTVMLNRGLGPANKGEYAYILLIATTLAMILEAGFATGISYKSGRQSNQNPNQWKTFSISISVIWFFLSCAFVIAMANLFSSNLRYMLIAGIFFFQISSKYILGNFLGSANIRQYNMFRIIPGIIQMAGLFILIFKGNGLSTNGAVIVYMVSVGFNYLISIVFLMPFKWQMVPLKELMSMAKYSFFIYIANMLSFLNYRIDMFIIKLMLPIEYLGWYSVSVFFIEKAKIFANSSSLVNFSYKINIMDRANTSFNLRMINTVNLMISAFFIILGYPLIILLYSADYAPAYLPVLILAPAIIINGLGKMLSSELSAEGIIRFQMFAGLVSVTINVLLNILLIPVIDIAGAALASLASYSLNTLIIYIYFKNHYKEGFDSNIFILRRDEIRRIIRNLRKRNNQ